MYTLYERLNRNRQEQAFGTCLGKIISVDSEKRTCTISTAMGVGTMNDQFIHSCQWASPDVNPDGDASGSIPRVGSWGLVHFVDGEPFMSGFIGPIGMAGSAKQGDKGPTLNEGDKMMSTALGNRITLKGSGLIECWAKENLQRVMMPQGSQILDICKRYNIKSDGGYIDWKTSDALRNTIWRAEYSKDILRTCIISEFKGYVSPTIVKRTYIGAAFPGVLDVPLPVYTQDIYVTGETVTTVTPPLPPNSPSGYKSTISPDGSIEILAGTLQTVKMTVDPLGAIHLESNSLASVDISETGDVDIVGPTASVSLSAIGDIAIDGPQVSVALAAAGDIEISNLLATATLSSSGDCSITGPSWELSLTAGGEVTLKGLAKMTLEANAGIDIKSSIGPINIEGMGPMNIKTMGQIMLDGGPGATDNVLCFPTTLSPFTGSPLVPFSTTVMVSK